MGQERLNNLAILSIEHEVARDLNYTDVIDSFAAAKARKVVLWWVIIYTVMFFVVAICHSHLQYCLSFKRSTQSVFEMFSHLGIAISLSFTTARKGTHVVKNFGLDLPLLF